MNNGERQVSARMEKPHVLDTEGVSDPKRSAKLPLTLSRKFLLLSAAVAAIVTGQSVITEIIENLSPVQRGILGLSTDPTPTPTPELTPIPNS